MFWKVSAEHLTGIKGASVAPDNAAYYRVASLHQGFTVTGGESGSRNAC